MLYNILGKKRCGKGTDAIKEENLVRTFTSNKLLKSLYDYSYFPFYLIKKENERKGKYKEKTCP